MHLTRRDFGRLGLGAAAALAAVPAGALSLADRTKEAILAFTGGVEPALGGIELNTPEIAENGSTVPVDVASAEAKRIMLLADGNPNPGVATFRFGRLSPARSAATRIRLAATQEVIAVAELNDGAFTMVSKTVKVTIGGCGG
ncbi:MAG: thiosulfate oxidation carrier protein SoxY [Pseudomonadota bacterium]